MIDSKSKRGTVSDIEKDMITYIASFQAPSSQRDNAIEQLVTMIRLSHTCAYFAPIGEQSR